MSDERYRDAVTTIERLAAEAFKNHVITAEGDRRWLCKRPGTGNYHFRVVLSPGHIIVFGDVGAGIARGSDLDMLPWVRGTCGGSEGVSRDYVISKLQTPHPKAFYPDDAIAYLRERLGDRDADESAAGLRDWLESAETAHACRDLHEHRWHELVDLYGGDGDDHSVGMNHDSDALWFVECLRCFIRLHDAMPANAFAGLV